VLVILFDGTQALTTQILLIQKAPQTRQRMLYYLSLFGLVPGNLQGLIPFKQPQAAIRRQCAPRMGQQAGELTVNDSQPIHDDHVE